MPLGGDNAAQPQATNSLFLNRDDSLPFTHSIITILSLSLSLFAFLLMTTMTKNVTPDIGAGVNASPRTASSCATRYTDNFHHDEIDPLLPSFFSHRQTIQGFGAPSQTPLGR